MKHLSWLFALGLVAGVVASPVWAQQDPLAGTVAETRARVLAILKRLETVGPFHGTSVTTVTGVVEGESKPPVTATSRIWQKGPYYRLEPVKSKEGTLIKGPSGFYLYQERADIYVQPPDFGREAMFQEFKLPPDASTGVERIWSDMLDSPALKIIGTDVLDGKPVTVVTYTASLYVVGQNDVKCWLWNDNGLALKTEEKSSLSGAAVGTKVTELHELVFEDIPDSLFAVPPEKVQKLPENWHP